MDIERRAMRTSRVVRDHVGSSGRNENVSVVSALNAPKNPRHAGSSNTRSPFFSHDPSRPDVL
jgi:hypothetical protein